MKRREGFTAAASKTEQFEAGLQIKKLLIIILLELRKEVSRETDITIFTLHQTRFIKHVISHVCIHHLYNLLFTLYHSPSLQKKNNFHLVSNMIAAARLTCSILHV